MQNGKDRYQEDVTETLAPEGSYTEFIAGCGTKFFLQKFESGRKILEAGWGSCVEAVTGLPSAHPRAGSQWAYTWGIHETKIK